MMAPVGNARGVLRHAPAPGVFHHARWRRRRRCATSSNTSGSCAGTCKVTRRVRVVRRGRIGVSCGDAPVCRHCAGPHARDLCGCGAAAAARAADQGDRWRRLQLPRRHRLRGQGYRQLLRQISDLRESRQPDIPGPRARRMREEPHGRHLRFSGDRGLRLRRRPLQRSRWRPAATLSWREAGEVEGCRLRLRACAQPERIETCMPDRWLRCLRSFRYPRVRYPRHINPSMHRHAHRRDSPDPARLDRR